MALTKTKKTDGQNKKAKKWLARWKQAHSTYQLTNSDLEICNKVKEKWSTTPTFMRSKLLQEAVRDVAKAHCKRKGLKDVGSLKHEKIEKAVRKWIRLKTRNRTKAAKIGTKGWHPRRVFYHQNKQQVADRAAELAESGRQTIGQTAQALTELFCKVPQEEKDKLTIVAHEWNSTGPPEPVQQG